MALIRLLFWIVLFLIATFAFTVLFEHGPSNFIKNSEKEFKEVQKFWNTKYEQKKDTSDKIDS